MLLNLNLREVLRSGESSCTEELGNSLSRSDLGQCVGYHASEQRLHHVLVLDINQSQFAHTDEVKTSNRRSLAITEVRSISNPFRTN